MTKTAKAGLLLTSEPARTGFYVGFVIADSVQGKIFGLLIAPVANLRRCDKRERSGGQRKGRYEDKGQKSDWKWEISPRCKEQRIGIRLRPSVGRAAAGG